jgi:hypothetical protein
MERRNDSVPESDIDDLCRDLKRWGGIAEAVNIAHSSNQWMIKDCAVHVR